MKNCIMATVMLFALACNNHIAPSNTAYQNKEIVNDKGTTILIGHNAPYMMKQGLYKDWFNKNYDGYSTDSALVLQLKQALQGKTIEVFLGSWCGDSKREVPRMMKVLEQAGFDSVRMHLIFVDYSLGWYKQSPQHEEKGKDIHHVPTFIVYEKNKELGRIVESPVVSLEKDLLAIVSHAAYAPKYKGIIQWQQIKNRDMPMSIDLLHSAAGKLKAIANFPGEFNGYGYMLYASGKKIEARNVFLLNTILFPDKPGTFSSLGEYYFLEDNTPEARRCYEKVLQLKPDDANAKKMLEQL